MISGDDITSDGIWWIKETPNKEPTASTLQECVNNIKEYSPQIFVQKMFQLHHVQKKLLYEDANILKIFFIALV